MTLELLVRFNNYVVDQLKLEEGEYVLGRDPSCDICINHSSVHRRHGKIFFKEGQWWFEDFQSEQVQSIQNDYPITLSTTMEMATPMYVAGETTGDIHHHRFKHRSKKEKLIYGFLAGFAVIFLSALGYYIFSLQMKHSDPNVLLSQVRSKVVEFEKIKNEEAIQDYIRFGNFTEKDFRDSVGFCTGFLVAPNVVLTASHCLWGNDYLDLQTDFEVRAFDGKKYKPMRVLGFDSIRDYLFLEMSGMESYGHLDFAPDFKIGQTVYTLGNAHGQGIAIREGIMANETEDVNDPKIKYIRFSAGASPGNSGGPLLDVEGRIVALVFAATGAENYNLGTSTIDLQEGFKKFVTSKDGGEVQIQAKKLFNFNAQAFLQKQMLPYLPDYNDYPELLEKVQDLQFVFKTPIDFDKVSETILGEVFTKSEAVVSEIEQELLKKGENTLNWKSFVSEKFPVIHPSQFDQSQNSFYKIKNRYYMKIAGFLDSPGKKEFKQYEEQFSKENKFDFQAYGMNTELVPSTESLLYKPKDTTKTRESLEDLAQGSLYSQFSINTKISDENLIPQFLKNYLGENGILNSSYSPFIKPQSYKQFVIHDIDKKPESDEVTDGSGRHWQRFHFLLFEQLHFYIYCMNMPEGSVCAARLLPIEDTYRLGIVEDHFRKYILGHFLENPYFWNPENIIKFKETDNGKVLSSFRGIDLTYKEDRLELKIPYFNVGWKLPTSVQSLRFQTGVFYTPEKEVIWTGYGADWIKPGSNPEVCGLGIEPSGTQSTFILNFMRDMEKRLKLKEDDSLNKEDVPKLWIKEASTKNGIKMNVYGYCAPLRENPIEIGYYFVDFKKAKPLDASFIK
ncbi:MAG: trypsin-like peptidase domain-containing protein [Bdellovibrionaceae bacterium]|nr:trypsin-like peptidase domain-containing protein [Pseudobdellovibrionaceae bacterium]